MNHFEKWLTSENGHNDIDHFENWSDRFQSASFVEMTIFSKSFIFRSVSFSKWPIFWIGPFFQSVPFSEIYTFPKRLISRSDVFFEATNFAKWLRKWLLFENNLTSKKFIFTVIKVLLPETAFSASLNDTIVIFLFESWYRRAEFYIQSKFVKVRISKLVSFFNKLSFGSRGFDCLSDMIDLKKATYSPHS